MRCRFPWCTVAHKQPGDTQHKGVVATFTNLEVIAFLVEMPYPLLDEAHVRMEYPVNGRVQKRQHDLTPTAAADWSEILDGIDIRELSSIANALYRAGVTLGASK